MHKFVRSLLTEWRRLKLPFTGETFVVAVSGGADSVSLALALNELKRLEKLPLRFVVAHFNHDLRGAESQHDEEFVKDFAERFGFELVYKIRNPKSEIQNQPGNLEQNARRARYEFFLETAENLRAFGVLTAHTLNDQAETFLLNLIRGSGLEGLGGMKTVRSLESTVHSPELKEDLFFDSASEIQNQKSEIKLIRPLLSWAKRETTENFCCENEIEFRHDSMNDDLAFKRVRIRKVLLPLLRDFNPKIVETLAKTANLLRADFAGLEKSAGATVKNFAANQPDKQSLELKELKNLFPSMRRQILREWLKKMRGNLRALDSNHVKAVENLIFSRKSGRVVQMPNGETVTKREGRLFFEKAKVEKSPVENYN
jgi:tRNA(Ile)-lysidine synthase